MNTGYRFGSWTHVSPTLLAWPFLLCPHPDREPGSPQRDGHRAREPAGVEEMRSRSAWCRGDAIQDTEQKELSTDILMYVSPYIRIHCYTYELRSVRTRPGGDDEDRGGEFEGRQRQDADELLSGDGSSLAGTDPGGCRRPAGLGPVVGG